MKKLLLLLFSFTTLTSVCYTSFPTIDTLKVNKDTIQNETVKDYHQRMTNMGFDLSNCMCKDCQKFKGVNKTTESQKSLTKAVLNTGLIVLVLVCIFALYLAYLVTSEVEGWFS